MNKEIIDKAKELGFDLIAFSSHSIEKHNIEHFNKWINNSLNGSMQYMEKIEPREDIQQILTGAKTVISLATNYYYDQEPLKKDNGRIARYAYGRDYHKIIKKRLIILEKFLKEKFPEEKSKSYVDTGPILERAYASQSGLGFIGKNSCLITKEFGSWVFLSELITTIKFETTDPIQGDQSFAICGSCRLCIDSCPTKAILRPGVIDANKCISYLTIENKGEINDKFQESIKESKRVFGCDICQEVCPHNADSKQVTNLEFKQKIAGDQLDVKKVLKIKDEKEFINTFAGSPLMRAKLTGLKRNSEIILKSSKRQNKQ